MGEITPSDGAITIDLTKYGVTGNWNDTPRARFIFEKELPPSDATHTKKRFLGVFDFSQDMETNAPGAKRNYISCCVYQNSGSSSLLAEKSNVAKMWNMRSASGSASYNFMQGSIDTGEATLFIASPSTANSPIAGRTYVWGVII